METILRDSRFWVAVLLLVQSILFYFVPDFPAEIWAAINAVAAIVIGSLAVGAGVQVARRRAAERAAKK